MARIIPGNALESGDKKIFQSYDMANKGHNDINGKVMAICSGRSEGKVSVNGLESKATIGDGKDILLPGEGLKQGTFGGFIKDG